MSIGLMRGTVAVESHKIEWEIAAREMIERLKNILMDDIVDAQHIGSTSIKSICAKPIVDIVVGVSSFDSMMRHNDELRTNGIVYWHNYINMRDYLNTHEEDAKEYADLKERLAKAYPKERIAYTDGKSALIERILQMADEWRKQL